jgi:GNAT superfamily N-acetyltransferase
MQIISYRPEHAGAFAALNRDWIERLFSIEPADLKVLNDPEHAIIAPGGEIFFALDGTTVVGTVALVPTGPRAFELAKMVVAGSHQGQGIGEALGTAAVEWARAKQADHLFLVTNSSLTGAIRLYERLGFVHRPMPPSDYARADVYMVHPL